jgi:hypothetical protein
MKIAFGLAEKNQRKRSCSSKHVPAVEMAKLTIPDRQRKINPRVNGAFDALWTKMSQEIS